VRHRSSVAASKLNSLEVSSVITYNTLYRTNGMLHSNLQCLQCNSLETNLTRGFKRNDVHGDDNHHYVRHRLSVAISKLISLDVLSVVTITHSVAPNSRTIYTLLMYCCIMLKNANCIHVQARVGREDAEGG